jgi:hypothetical protein
MSRIRTIKPEFFIDDELAELSPLHRLLFIGLWTLADREGRLEDRPKRIRAQVLPFDDGDTDKMLQDLHDGGFVQRYEADGKRYLVVTGFVKHQRITGSEAESRSQLPPPPESRNNSGNTVETPWNNSGNTQDDRKGKEGKGKEGKGRTSSERCATRSRRGGGGFVWTGCDFSNGRRDPPPRGEGRHGSGRHGSDSPPPQ